MIYLTCRYQRIHDFARNPRLLQVCPIHPKGLCESKLVSLQNISKENISSLKANKTSMYQLATVFFTFFYFLPRVNFYTALHHLDRMKQNFNKSATNCKILLMLRAKIGRPARELTNRQFSFFLVYSYLEQEYIRSFKRDCLCLL